MRVGFIGWRGMVGSVLLGRMREERDFSAGFEAEFYSTSQVGTPPPDVGLDAPPLLDAYDIARLSKLDVIVTCQGGDYTTRVAPALREAGWQGYWIDAASTLRMADDAVIVLDPINRTLIDEALDRGVRYYIGGNCTVSLMLMALAGLFRQGWVEWVSTMTYQAASGAGARQMRELVEQMRTLGSAATALLDDPAAESLAIDRVVTAALRSADFPHQHFGAPLAASLIPWIDRPMEQGETREEWKGYVETQRILATQTPIPIDGICVRVGSMRCHSQALTIKLRQDVPLEQIEAAIAEAHPWVHLVPNTKEATLAQLTPAAVSGKLDVPIGRLRKMRLGPEYLAAFTVGDQLLWGAAEPLRRMLRILIERGR